MRHFLHKVLRVFATAIVLFVMTVGGGVAPNPVQAAVPRVAYIYANNTAARDAFVQMLTSKGFVVDTFAMAEIANGNFTNDQSLIIGDDTGSAGQWDAVALRRIASLGLPVLGIGNGGSSFFSGAGLFINFGQSWLSTGKDVHISEPTNPLWSTPTAIPFTGQTISLFTSSGPMVSVFDDSSPYRSNVNHIGRESGNANHFPIIAQSTQSPTGAPLCDVLWGFQSTPATMTDAGKNLFTNLLAGNPCGHGNYVLNSIYAGSAPVLDGALSYGEWDLSQSMAIDHGFIAAVNDGTRLHILIDSYEDTTNSASDYFWLTFDKNQDKAITPNVDLLYGLTGSNLRYSYFLGTGQFTGSQPSTFSAMGQGFGCYFADFTLFVTLRPFNFRCSNHRIWELGIDLNEIGGNPGGQVYMGLRHFSDSPRFIDEVPANLDGDLSNYIKVNLAPLPYAIVRPLKGAVPYFASSGALEVTQAIQNTSNSLPVVAQKATAARAYVGTGNVAIAQYTTVYLYGSVAGVDLPGSPLVKTAFAKTTINRALLDNSINFSLPKSWLDGNVAFHVDAVDLSGNHISSTPQTLSFVHRGTPTMWVIPLNEGSVASPTTASNSWITTNESYIRTIYPVPAISFVQKPWQVIGTINPASTLDDSIATLRSYYNNVVIGWLFTVIFTGNAPFALPDQIYGFRTGGGGLSDPTWYNSGSGRVAAGYYGTSAEGTMGHEINHNLDRSSTGTWGRHAPGCGAGGPDPSWPWGSDVSIHDFGFDTRLPWGSNTVVPSTFPDIMSYCQSGSTPTKWISTYRWQNLFNNTYTTLGAAKPLTAQQALAAVVPNSLYVSGVINANNTGKLNPVLVEPGMPDTIVIPGEYSIVLLDASATPLLTKTLSATFVDMEGNPINQVSFSYVLPPTAGVKTVQLLHGATVLDQINVSSAAPTVTVTNPHGGEVYNGVQNITWTASDADTPAADLRFNIFYSADNGASWIPIGNNVSGTSFAVDGNGLPKSSAAKIRIVVTDGFNTGQADSSGTFTVPAKSPLVKIATPTSGISVASGNTLNFEGEAITLDDQVIPETNFVWSADNGTFLGTGKSTSANLADGTHSVTLTVTDNDGLSSTASVTVFVNVTPQVFYLPNIRR